jgi:hypothetical protein
LRAFAGLVLLFGTAAARPAVLTIVDGDAAVIDGVRRIAAIEGLVVGEGALIETGPRLRVLRVEWPDGTVADFAQDTQAMLMPRPIERTGGSRPAFYLLQGWAKQSSLGAAPAPGSVMPAVQVEPFSGALVSHVAGPAEQGASFFFCETGSAALFERARGSQAAATLMHGQSFAADAQGKWQASARPTARQLGSVPAGFRDPLPLRASTFAGRTIAGRPLPAPTYAELGPWLTAERGLRDGFTRRFAPLLRDPAFRRALDAHLADHPEWGPVLHPKPPAPPPLVPALR